MVPQLLPLLSKAVVDKSKEMDDSGNGVLSVQLKEFGDEEETFARSSTDDGDVGMNGLVVLGGDSMERGNK